MFRRKTTQQRPHAARCRQTRIVFVFARLAECIRGGVVVFDVVVADRPARMLDPRPGLEVDRVERDTAAAPERSTAAETTLPVFIRRTVQRFVHDLASIQSLCFGGGSKVARLEQQDALAGAGKFHRQGDPGRAAADNADIGVDHGATNNLVRVLYHRLGSSTGGHTDGVMLPSRGVSAAYNEPTAPANASMVNSRLYNAAPAFESCSATSGWSSRVVIAFAMPALSPGATNSAV